MLHGGQMALSGVQTILSAAQAEVRLSIFYVGGRAGVMERSARGGVKRFNGDGWKGMREEREGEAARARCTRAV
eukprot:1016066-Rhodomonas_salina.2